MCKQLKSIFFKMWRAVSLFSANRTTVQFFTLPRSLCGAELFYKMFFKPPQRRAAAGWVTGPAAITSIRASTSSSCCHKNPVGHSGSAASSCWLTTTPQLHNTTTPRRNQPDKLTQISQFQDSNLASVILLKVRPLALFWFNEPGDSFNIFPVLEPVLFMFFCLTSSQRGGV